MIYRLLTAATVLFVLSACATLPTDYERASSTALQDTAQTRLSRNLSPLIDSHPGKSGFEPLFTGIDAFVARWVLADAAERSLDVQYYIWHDDDTGKLLLHQLLRAADRGVRVRLLLDDFYTATYDLSLTALASHVNLDVRVFNPFVARKRRVWEAVTSFRRINRRMHNKSFTADNQVTIVGGRNIGDVYFDAQSDFNYTDFDVVAVGPVVREVSSAFDTYWNSDLAVPITVLEKPVSAPQLERARETLQQHVERMRSSEYSAAVRASAFLERLTKGDVLHFWG